MPSVEPSCRVGRVVGYPPLSDMDERQPREFPEALLEAGTFEDLPGRWQAAILEAELHIRYASDGTRTRDLRRDRPLRPPRRKTTGDDRGRAIAQPMRD
jgi:hypothetical protein